LSNRRARHLNRLQLGLRAMLALILTTLVMNTASGDEYSEVEIRTRPLRGGVHLMTGVGGNLAALSGDDGILLVDDQYGPLGDKIRRALARIGEGPIRFVVNTHWHGDHTGGNEGMAATGAVIVAHENVRTRMSTEQFMAGLGRPVPASPDAALPVVTFAETLSFHFSGETIRVEHLGPAHTDGDAMVHFVEANVLHMGDTFFNGMYPFIDLSSGGRLEGLIAASDRGLALANAETMIVPGHGPLGDREQLVAYRDMLVDVRDRIRIAIRVGKSRAAVIASQPTQAHDDRWGRGFMKPDVFTGLAYDSLSGR
jgi:cyclase